VSGKYPEALFLARVVVRNFVSARDIILSFTKNLQDFAVWIIVLPAGIGLSNRFFLFGRLQGPKRITSPWWPMMCY